MMVYSKISKEMTSMGQQTATIEFPNGKKSSYVTVSQNVDIETSVKTLGLQPPRALLIINGRTADLDPTVAERLIKIYLRLAKFLIDEKITVVTGGTDAEIFQLLGKALRKLGGPVAPCIGVAVKGKAGFERLETNHSHFILVEGDHWGEETSVMYNLISILTSHCPSLALFAGGGEVTISEILQNVMQDREMIFLEGVGGLTEEIIDDRINTKHLESGIETIKKKGRITVLPANHSAVDLVNIIHSRLINNE